MVASLAALETAEEMPGTVRHSAVLSSEMSLGQLLGHRLPCVMQGVHIHATLHMVPSICYFKGDQSHTFFLRLTQNGYSDPSDDKQ